MFKDRHDAGRKLAKALERFAKAENTLVLGLPRGGVPVAYEVAHHLRLPLDITCPHKIGAPMNPEYAIGAVTEEGEGIFNDHVIEELGVSRSYIDGEVAKQAGRAKRCHKLYRGDRKEVALMGKQVLLVDDGLATGFTMKAAIRSVKAMGARQVVVAVPVAPPDTVRAMRQMADEVVCLDAPATFRAVGQFYEDFTQTTDEEVIALLLRNG
jgi:putative phosphoribosyl transferase